MSSYIIAGSADSLDTAYCEQIARRIKAKYKNIDFRVVIKHPSEWEEYLNQICRIYGFPKKSNPIIYTYHGKIIGNKEAFVENTFKYFGLNEQSLLVPNLTTTVNVKLANQQLQRKITIKNNIKTLQQKINSTYERLLKQGILKHQFKVKNQFLVNGIEYYFRQVAGLCSAINFPQNFDVKIEKQNIEASDLNLMALSAQDQIPADDTKQAFVTNQNNQALNNDQMEKMSQASKTNRLHSSIMSRDEDSKINKQSNQQKQKIDEQFDDVTDYTNVNMEETLICEIGDHFCIAFEKNGSNHIPGEMIFYYNQAQSNGNILRVYNEGNGRPVIGHHNIIKQIHYIGESESQQLQQSHNTIQDQNDEESQISEKKIPNQQESSAKQKKEQSQKNIVMSAEKSKTQPNLQQSHLKPPLNIEDEALSEPCSDLNLVSNLNYHTLYMLKPLSSMELRYILHLVKETNSVACLQFLPQNPNPKVKVYSRAMLLQTKDSLFPVQSFIEKQLQDGEFETLSLPRQQEQKNQEQSTIKMLKINNIGFNHLYFTHQANTNEEQLSKSIKAGIDDIMYLEQKLKKQIGYCLIMTKKYTMIVALAEPYRMYGGNNLYFDGLSFLGYVQIAKLIEGYKLKQQKINSGQSIRDALARSSAYQFSD